MGPNIDLGNDSLTNVSKTSKGILKAVGDLAENEQLLKEKLEQLSGSDLGQAQKVKQQTVIMAELKRNARVRAALLKTLPGMIQTTAAGVANSRGALANQLTVAEIMNHQLKEAEVGLGKVAGTQDNKMRMVEVNTYYSDQYQAQASLMKLIIIVSVAFLLIVILMKKKLIPTSVATTLLVGIVLIGAILIVMRYLNITSRSSMVFDEYEWNADPPAYDPGTAAEFDGDMGFSCLNGICCGPGTVLEYGTTLEQPNRCVIKEEAGWF